MGELAQHNKAHRFRGQGKCGVCARKVHVLIRGEKRLRRLTERSWGVSMNYRYTSLRLYIHGWMNYFVVGMKYNDIVEMDHWLRRRIRMCYWKQWRRGRRRIGNLIQLGSPKYQAILTGLSRKSYWHLAKTLSTNMGLSKAFLEKQGLVSIRALWIQTHYPAKAR